MVPEDRFCSFQYQHFARYEMLIVLASSELNLKLFSVFLTLVFSFSCIDVLDICTWQKYTSLRKRKKLKNLVAHW